MPSFRVVARKLFTFFKVTVIWVVLQLAVFASSKLGVWVPPASLITKVEANLTMPPDASGLGLYVRYYSGRISGGRRLLVGTFLREAEHAGIRIVDMDKMPQVFEGGCSVITLTYDIERKKVLSLFCNGVA